LTRTHDDAIARLESARERAPVAETEQALARLESVLFGRREPERVLDRYPIIGQLGSGGGGVVYLARDPELDREVAIKVLHAERTGPSRSRARARLLREARVMASSPHPNVVTVYDVGVACTPSDRESAYIVMEYVPGPSLGQWLDTPRSWQDVVRVFTAAGRGLAAAHQVGVVHRDFKPSNVIVAPAEKGESGERVRVLDFGLAVEVDEEASTPGPEDSLSDASSGSRLTEHGAILGTPLYMAPEQHVGLEADAAADQFAFCVALWEALVGCRPYSARSLEDLAEAKAMGPPELPKKLAAPRHVLEVVSRGLAPRPVARWESMDALLAALARARHRRSRGVILAATFVPLIGLGLAAWPHEDRCKDAGREIESVWSDGRARSVRDAFASTGLPSAERFAADTLQAAEAYASAWVVARRDACFAMGDDGGASRLLDRRVACLERARERFAAAASVLEGADEIAVLRAHSLVESWPSLSDCTDPERLLAPFDLPADEASVPEVARLRAGDARARALLVAGSVDAGYQLAVEVADAAEAVGYCPVMVEALATRGTAEQDLGRYDVAVETLERAYAQAVSCNHDRIAADVAIELVTVYGDGKRELESALHWADVADADLVRSGRDDYRFDLLLARGSAYEAAGNYERALTLNREALTLAQTDRRRAAANNNLGLAARRAGDLEVARTALTKADALWERELGGDHPLRAATLNNLGGLALLEGSAEQAGVLFRSVVEMRERMLGDAHVKTAEARSNLGIALRRLERFDEAREQYRLAQAVLEPDKPGLGAVLNGAALVETRAGNHAAALRLLDRVVVVEELRLPADHPLLANPFQNRAEAQARVGLREQADRSFARALSLKIAADGETSGRVAWARLNYAKALSDGGDGPAAQALAEEALAALDQSTHTDVRDALVQWLETSRRRYADAGGL